MTVTTYPDCCCPSSGGGVTVDCCPSPVATTLLATVTGATGDCSCLPASFAIVWDGVSKWSSSTGSLCTSHTFNMQCPGGGHAAGDYSADFDSDTGGTLNAITASCDPLNLSFTFIAGGVPCTGSFTVTVTTPP